MPLSLPLGITKGARRKPLPQSLCALFLSPGVIRKGDRNASIRVWENGMKPIELSGVVTVRGASGEQVVYVNEAGLIMPAPVTTTTVEKVEPVQPAVESSQTVVTYGEVQKDTSRYELLTKKGDKEVYRDKQTGQKVTVKRQNN
jgi:hypothetical protein